jgi:putative PIN family toxin of toxin-antitoxin system
MIKIVPDANILISGMLGHHGPPRKIINLFLAKKIVMFGSKETYEEFCEKVKIPRLQKYWKAQIFTPEKLILDYRSIIKMVEPFEILAGVNIVKADPDDDIYFRAAKACEAKIIVTGDKEVLGVKKYDDIIVVTAANFIESFSKLNQSKFS